MAKTAIKKADTDAGMAEREAPIIKTDCIQPQSEGFQWREFFVRMPDGLVVQDLQDSPHVWKAIQSNKLTALRRFDRVTCVAHDESWIIKDAMVIDASLNGVTLSFDPRIIKIPGRDQEFETEKHVIRWDGPGFAVLQKPGYVRAIPNYYQTLEAAKTDMYQLLYPKQVA